MNTKYLTIIFSMTIAVLISASSVLFGAAVENVGEESRPVCGLTRDDRGHLLGLLDQFYKDQCQLSKTDVYEFGRNIDALKPTDRIRLITELNVQLPIQQIQAAYKSNGVVPLRPLAHNKLILSCGNHSTFLRGHLHTHVDADTVDSDVGINPTIVADLSNDSFFDWVAAQGKTYDEILHEAGYDLCGQPGIKKLRKILKVGGNYYFRVSFINVF